MESIRTPSSITWNLFGATIAVVLLALVVGVAGPAMVWQLIRSTEFSLLPAALLTSAAILGLRGLRLALLLDSGELGWVRGTLVAAAAQAATLFGPARFGELALPWLLRSSTGRSFSSNVGTLLAARALDLSGLGLWLGVLFLAVGGFGKPTVLALAGLLLLPTLLLPWTVRLMDSAGLRCLATRGLRGRRWARRVRRIREEIEALRARPFRLWAAISATFAMWGLQWTVAWILLRSMGYDWPPVTVAAGSAGAAVTSLLPFNLIGNLGTLEAGWTATFSALGVPVQIAAASGLAAHLWGMIFAAVFGAAAWALLSWKSSTHPEQSTDNPD